MVSWKRVTSDMQGTSLVDAGITLSSPIQCLLRSYTTELRWECGPPFTVAKEESLIVCRRIEV